AQQTFDLQARVEQLRDALNRVDQITQAFQCVVLALHGNDYPVGSGQGVDGQHRQRRRTVDENVVVILPYRRQCVAQTVFLGRQVEQRHLGSRQVSVGGQQLITTMFGILHGIDQAAFADQHVVD